MKNAERFPENLPYGGAFAEVVPHLTVAQLADRGRLDEIAADFLQSGGRRLPLHARAAEVALMDNTRGTWEVRTLFQLGSITPE